MFPETVLLVTEDLVVLKEVHQMTMDDVLEDFGANRYQRYRSVIGRLAFISLFEDWRNIRLFPVVRGLSLFQRCLENQSQYGCERLSHFLEEPRRYVIRACSFVGLQVP